MLARPPVIIAFALQFPFSHAIVITKQLTSLGYQNPDLGEAGALTGSEMQQMAATGTADDGLRTSFAKGELVSPPKIETQTSESGYQVAKRWNECKRKLSYSAALSEHSVDSVASMLHNFLFVDNVKAGSSSVRNLLQEKLNRSWTHSDVPGVICTHNRSRTVSSDFKETSNMFKFSIVRDPVVKFESGVRQARFQDSEHFASLSADEVLDEVIRLGSFTNEHLQPSSYRLSAFDASTSPSMLSLDFVGKLEHIDQDWPEIVDAMNGLDGALKDVMKTDLVRDNSREDDPSSKLSDAGIRRMCESRIYKLEWECFNYELPEVCKRV